MRDKCRHAALACILVLAFGARATETAGDCGNCDPEFEQPSAAIAALIDAKPAPTALVSPYGAWLAVLERPRRPSIADVSRPMRGLAGVRFYTDNLVEPYSELAVQVRASNRAAPGSTSPPRELRARFESIVFLAVDGTSAARALTGLPSNARLMHPVWAPDGSRLAFSVVFDDRIELWAAKPATGHAEKVSDRPLNGIMGTPCSWHPSNTGLVCRTRVLDSAEPPEPAVPAGPVVREHSGRAAPARTYQYLLQNGHDAALLQHFFSAQITYLSLRGPTQDIGTPGMHVAATYSPDGKHLLVETIEKPFSYLVPLHRFPVQHSVWSANGTVEFALERLPLAERVPIGRDSVRTGPRVAGWRSDAEATIYWVQAADGGDASQSAAVRDELFILAAPFTESPTLLARLSQRFLGVQWGDEELALVWDDWWQTRRRRAFVYRPGDPASKPRMLFDFSIQDAYSDPGTPVMTLTPGGYPVLLRDDDGARLLVRGAGATPDGDLPFLARLDWQSGERQMLYRSEPPYYEKVIAVTGTVPLEFVTQRESATTPPKFMHRIAGPDSSRELYSMPDPYPELAGIRSESIRFQRDDGLWLSAKVYLPRDFEEKHAPLPGIMWAYPLEFRQASDASQQTGSPHRFPVVSLRSMLPWATSGYVIFDNLTMPVVGSSDEEPNDSFIEQIVANSEAAIREGVRRGMLDPERVAIAGHSYGAFMAANLLANSDLFRTGIARSGAYNRSLTPFGFQREERIFWDARDLYVKMSPFMQADRIDEPLLLIHGSNDENSGTHPMQSERLFAALQGLGSDVRLVMLPKEGHSYLARESVLHQAYEISVWLERHLGNAGARTQDAVTCCEK